MAQVSFLIGDLPTSDSALQISSCSKQEDLADLAVRGSLFDRKEGNWM
jgi:hypothetical protein